MLKNKTKATLPQHPRNTIAHASYYQYNSNICAPNYSLSCNNKHRITTHPIRPKIFDASHLKSTIVFRRDDLLSAILLIRRSCISGCALIPQPNIKIGDQAYDLIPDITWRTSFDLSQKVKYDRSCHLPNVAQ